MESPQQHQQSLEVPARGAVDSRLRRAWFEFRAGGLRTLRGVRNLREGRGALGRAPHALGEWPVSAGASRTPLWNTRDAAEFKLTAGKVQNLRVAARRLHGLVIPAGGVFSFWRALGRPVRSRGFVAGRELREGCMVASVGGGLCQLSNALYAAALEAGMVIIERHAHSRIVPGSLAERGLDATVFWNYLDLRFRVPADCLLDVQLSHSHLQVRLRLREALPPRALARAAVRPPFTVRAIHRPVADAATPAAHDCIACAQEDCAEYIAPVAHAGRNAWLLDEVWPEFDRWLGAQAQAGDVIALPLDGRRRHKPGYAWSVSGLQGVQVVEHPVLAVARGLGSRLLAAQGAARQRNLARMEALLAHAYARLLGPEVEHATIALNLLPYLWRSGLLAGRRFTVLLNRSPLALLHAQLDRARALHPHSPTLGDFRADDNLLRDEDAALRAATRLVTPHRAVAAYARANYPAVLEQLDWVNADARAQAARGGAVLFPASALGRKGAYEVREACRELKLPVAVLGAAREQDDFWRGVEARSADPRDPWAGVACVALPAFVEHRPRLLLQARARGLPVVCSEDCGLATEAAALQVVPAGALAEITRALERAAA